MDRIVSNATPLMYLAKVSKLILLKTLLNQVLIPEAVFQEVVIEGKRLALSPLDPVRRACVVGEEGKGETVED